MEVRRWFITGAGSGLGAALVHTAIAAGDTVVAAARTPDAAVAALPGSERLTVVALDVTDEARAAEVVGEAGQIDVLVNGAGNGIFGAIEEVSDAEARAQFEVNVFGLLNVTRAALPAMRERRGGRIVNIGSAAGIAGEPGVGAYCAAKFAVAGITESLARELADFGVEAMVVEPSGFRTNFIRDPQAVLVARPLGHYEGTPAGETRAWAAGGHGTQVGDPALGAEVIYAAAVAGRMPEHLPLGGDAVAALESKLDSLRRDLEPWRERSLATAFDD